LKAGFERVGAESAGGNADEGGYGPGNDEQFFHEGIIGMQRNR